MIPWSLVIYVPIYFMYPSLALGQTYDHPNACKASVKDVDKIIETHNQASVTCINFQINSVVCSDVSYFYWLRHGEGYVFIIVRWFVCLSASNTREKRMTGFLWDFQDRWDFVHGTFCKILRIFRSTFCIQEFSSNFRGISVSVSNITETRMGGFSWQFQSRLAMRKGTI